MAVAPLSIPGYQQQRDLDFSSLAQLPQVFQQARDQSIERETLASLGQGGQVDPMRLIQSGNLKLANLGINMLNQQKEEAYKRERASVEDKFRERQLGQTAAYQNAQLAISRQNADNATDYTPEERAKMAADYGLERGTPEFKTFVLTGAIPARTSANNLPKGFEYAPDGSLKPIKGGPADPDYLRAKGDRQNAPSGYVWNDPADPSKGLKAIPGGPGEKVDAEVAARLGLARSFLTQLPKIKEAIAAGEATGPIDAAKGYAGIGRPGELRRQIDSGAEALLRMLTGAGMNKEEAAEYTRRYKFSPTDTSETLMSKLGQLEAELNSVGETVGRGRGGWESLQPKPAAPQQPQRLRFNPQTGDFE